MVLVFFVCYPVEIPGYVVPLLTVFVIDLMVGRGLGTMECLAHQNMNIAPVIDAFFAKYYSAVFRVVWS